MGTSATVIVPTDASTRPSFRVIVISGDGYPTDLGKDLMTHITNLERATQLVNRGCRPYFDPSNWELTGGDKHYFYFQKWTSPGLQDLINSANYVYRFNPRNNAWYLWVSHYGWVKMTDPFPTPFKDSPLLTR